MPKKKLLVVGGACFASLVAFSLLFTWVVSSGMGPQKKLRVALSLLDEERWDVAGRIARELGDQVDPDADATWQYVQGVSKLQSVQLNIDSPKNRRTLIEATAHLVSAEKIGFPAGYQGKGQFYLGWCYFNTYQWEAAAKQLQGCEQLWPQRRSDVFAMTIEAHLRKIPADTAAASVALDAWAAIPGMSANETARIQLSRAHVDFVEQNYASCERALSKIPESLPEHIAAQLWRGRWRLEQAKQLKRSGRLEANSLFADAAEIVRIVRLAADTPPDQRRQAAYISGLILRAQGELSEAMSTFSAARQSNPRSAEAIAAGMEEAEIMVEQGQLEDALANLHHMLRNIEDLSLYNELWMPVDEFRARLLRIGRIFRQQEEFERAIRLAKHIALAFPESDSVRLQAEAFEEWAEAIAASPAGNTNLAQADRRELIANKHLTAGQLFENLARLELRSIEYPDIVWRSIVNYQQANELEKANSLLVDYLRYEDRTKRPRGFVALGRNHLNSAHWSDALDPLQRCLIEHPTHPISFEARLLAAKALFELDRLDEAADLLGENLSGATSSLRPESEIWRNSLYQLGQTIFRDGDQLILEQRIDPATPAADRIQKLEESHEHFLQVVNRLGEFVSRYPDDPRHYEARYLVAKSHRLAAETPRHLALTEKNQVETARRKLLQERRQLLEKSLDEFRALYKTINANHDALTTSEQNKALVRNCFFGEADTLYELGRWDDAILAYQNVASRHLNQPESLEALLQMAQCHRKLGQQAKAKKVLAQAEQVLNRIPADLDNQFVALTRASRQGWSDLITSLKSWD